ncbi:Zinc finger MYM-type protein 3 [Eumeta japonica]|uniref:Zinc finger MYM-type protein 3 n=1 Tax=Eumeta variegata TaxID=151549 RepID=A0A4C1VU77_EUMVA|nr:Zinc finger MYM-type protein 3 [Eumeta japonica]
MEVEESERKSDAPLDDNKDQEVTENTEVETFSSLAGGCETDEIDKNGSNDEEPSISISDKDKIVNSECENLQNHIETELNSGNDRTEKLSDLTCDVPKTELHTEENASTEMISMNEKENEVESQETLQSDNHSQVQESDENIVKDEHNGMGDEGGRTQTETDCSGEMKDGDDIENPQFENAPNISADESQEDHSQALDPFDALLKDTPNENLNEERSSSQLDTNNSVNMNIDDDDDDHHGDPVDTELSHDADHDEHTPDETLEESDNNMQEITDEPGADEEVCLLPDTEREISDADKAKAEQVLAEKRKQAEELAALQIPKSENEVMETDESAENEKESGIENSDIGDHIETAIEETNPESEPDKEKENETDRMEVNEVQNNIYEISAVEGTCIQCSSDKLCKYRFVKDHEFRHICSEECLHTFQSSHSGQYTLIPKKYIIEEIEPKQMCIKALNDSENNRYMYKRKKLPRKPVQSVQNAQNAQNKPALLKLKVISNATDKYLDEGYKVQQKTPAMVQAMREYRERSFIRKCIQCNTTVTGDEKNLVWETMDFCSDGCLSRYQNKIGAKCANCRKGVMHTSLGKYCVRFGYDIRQFCNSGCLEEFKKGLKICCYCQRDISMIHEGFLAPVGDKGQFKDFCSQVCMEKFDQMSKNPVPPPVWSKCAVCTLEKPTTIEVEVSENHSQRLCSEPCFAAFKFVNSIVPGE